jgi:hypothetical protein
MTLTATEAWTQPPGYAPAIFHDLFPSTAQFLAPTQSVYPRSRLVLTAPPYPRLFLFVDSPYGPSAHLVAEYDPNTLYGSLREGIGIPITAPTPAFLLVTPEVGCGCGSRLKNFTPFSSMRHSPTPQFQGDLNEFRALAAEPTP